MAGFWLETAKSPSHIDTQMHMHTDVVHAYFIWTNTHQCAQISLLLERISDTSEQHHPVPGKVGEGTKRPSDSRMELA